MCSERINYYFTNVICCNCKVAQEADSLRMQFMHGCCCHLKVMFGLFLSSDAFSSAQGNVLYQLLFSSVQLVNNSP